MKLHILIVLLFTTLISCGQKKDAMFLDKILNDYSRNSYFIVVKTATGNRSALSLIDNDDLYFYVHEKKGLEKEAYKKFILPFLNENESLGLTKSDFKKYGFAEIKAIPAIDADAKKGKAFFLNKYFKNKVIIDGITNEKKNYIIKILYDWGIASKIDDETGYLIITE